jgi:methylase of polypeptide subunit release factors
MVTQVRLLRISIVAMDRTRTAPQRKSEGAHYTPASLADFVARRIVQEFRADAAQGIKILDPACGDGSLLTALIRALRGSSESAPDVHVYGFDTSVEAARRAEAALSSLHFRGTLAVRADDFLEVVAPSITLQESLFNETSRTAGSFDVVIANPPYVRTQVMGSEKSQRLAATFDLAGKVDLYFAFIRGIGHVLKPAGVAGIIVSNRFMTTKSGAALREYIHREFDVVSVCDLGDTRLFEAAVLPAVLILRRKQRGLSTRATEYISIYSVRDAGGGNPASNVFEALSNAGRHQVPSGEVFEVKKGHLDMGPSQGSVWRLATGEGDNWLATVAKHATMTFADVGAIRVGIKTTADKIFIRRDWDDFPPDERPELLRPIITHHGAQRFRSARLERGPSVLYTHTVKSGRRVPVNLAEHPKSQRYLEQHRERLASRTFLLEAGRQWFEIWVPQDPDTWRLPKLVFRDIAEKPMFWIDRDGAIVNGDCYWLAVEESRLDLLYLTAAVGNSTFIETFYDHRFNNKLYAGRRRFITQYVREFPLPNPASNVARSMVALTKKLIETEETETAEKLALELDDLTWRSFGLRREESRRKADL